MSANRIIKAASNAGMGMCGSYALTQKVRA